MVVLGHGMRLCSRWWSTFDVWDVAVGGVGRGVGSDSNTGPNPLALTLTDPGGQCTPPSETSLGYVYSTFCNTTMACEQAHIWPAEL